MKEGDILPLNIPEFIEARVDGVPIMECSYGKFNGQYALKVEKMVQIGADDKAQGGRRG